MKITIIGCGNMGQALAQRLSAANTIFLYDRNKEKTRKLQQEGHGTACDRLDDALQQSELVILAVKPQSLLDAAKLFSSKPPPNQILVSILAGTPISSLKELFPHHRIMRMMPNLAVIYGEGVIGLASDKPLTNKENEVLSKLCTPLGKLYWLDESKFDAFTALGGSGPAFMLALIESMIDTGIRMGFNAKDAQSIVQQMIMGTLHLLDKSGKHPGELKWQITSPGGTTIEGLKKLEELGMRGNLMNVFAATYDRAQELSKIINRDK